MSEMVDRLALVAEEMAGYDDAGKYVEDSHRYIDNWPEVIRAVLEVMREPTASMSEAGVMTFINDDRPSGQPYRAWQTMIDAALGHDGSRIKERIWSDEKPTGWRDPSLEDPGLVAEEE